MLYFEKKILMYRNVIIKGQGRLWSRILLCDASISSQLDRAQQGTSGLTFNPRKRIGC